VKKILCPVDDSEAAANAMAYAGKFAHEVNYGITLLRLYSLFEPAASGTLAGEMQEQCDEVTRVFKVPCEYQIDTYSTNLASRIGKLATGHELIIMGTDGPDDLTQFFFGTHTYNTAAHSNTPVLIIPKEVLYTPIKSITFAYDYVGQRKLPLNNLIAFTTSLKAELTVLEVMESAAGERMQTKSNCTSTPSVRTKQRVPSITTH
jgi:Universal stress protein family